MDTKMKKVKFEDIGMNSAFLVQRGEEPARWASKIDDSRFILIGESGSYHPQDTDDFFIEAVA
jgi:hypothetical protein